MSSRRSARAPPRVARYSDLNGLRRAPCSCITLYASLSVCSSEKLVPPPTSVPMPTLSLCFSAIGRLNRPLPRKKFEVGQNEMAEPVSARRAHSSSHRCTPWANTERSPSNW
ncbi:hypothetical protein D9M71_790150 [compost metagenome]